jgi:hypothetical protein
VRTRLIRAAALALVLAGLGGARAADDPPNPEAAFAHEVQAAVRAGDAKWLAAHARYPVKVFGHKALTIRDRQAFVAQYSAIMTPELKEKILEQDPDKLFKNYQGSMIGDVVNIWFYNFGDSAEHCRCGIIAINNGK